MFFLQEYDLAFEDAVMCINLNPMSGLVARGPEQRAVLTRA